MLEYWLIEEQIVYALAASVADENVMNLARQSAQRNWRLFAIIMPMLPLWIVTRSL